MDADYKMMFEVARWLITSMIGLYAWIIGRQAAKSQEMLELRTRLTKLESDLKQVPSHKEFHELALQVGRVAGSVDKLTERIEPIRNAVNRVEGHLLTHNK